VIGTCAEFPPFEFFGADGSVQGIDIDLMSAIAKKLNMELVIENMDFNQIIGKVVDGTLDVGAAGITVNEERMKIVDFSTGYYSGCQVMIVPNHSEIKGKDDLRGKVVSVQSGATGESLAKELQLDIVSFPRASDAVLAVLHNNADVAIMDDEPAKRFQTKNSIRIKILPEKLTVEVYGLAVNKKNARLLDDLNRCLDEMTKNGELDAIFGKWMHN